jgi:hypothetical protein
MTRQYNIDNFLIKIQIEPLSFEERKRLLFKKYPGYEKVMVTEGTYATYFQKQRIPEKRIRIKIESLTDYQPVVETEIK